jgi:two-component system, sensor histidine kinase PdtaS
VVHEILSRDTADEVDFNDILPPLVRMAEDLSSTASPVKVTWSGEAGEMGAQVATPLAVALNELLQNAVEHAFVSHSEELQPEVHVLFDRKGDELSVQVKDNGSGLPADFSIDKTTSLGLSIVRGLVKSQLGGKIRMYNSGGTVVELVVPVSRAESSDLARI